VALQGKRLFRRTIQQYSLMTACQSDSTSAESFEKTLSALSAKISKTSANNDRLRQRARRLKVGWSIYGGFTYILAVLILIFVTGRPNWGAVEYSILSGGPVLYVFSLAEKSTSANVRTGFMSYATFSMLGTAIAFRTRKITSTACTRSEMPPSRS
jgi:hypothetical protein